MKATEFANRFKILFEECFNEYINEGMKYLQMYEKNVKKINIFNILYYKKDLKKSKKYFKKAGKVSKIYIKLYSFGDRELTQEEIEKYNKELYKYGSKC